MNHTSLHSSDPHSSGAAAGTGAAAIHRRPLRLALVNDYEIIVRGLHSMLSGYRDRVVVVEHHIGGIPE
ncbi:MAG TPA: hypothetical protein VK917_02145, partial [Ilumatobacter sp.]|nr:hypothetical protein [Ilumatobacter sp.]